MTQLDDVFAEIGLDRGDAVLFEKIVEPNFLRDHRLALGHGLGARRSADFQHRRAHLFGSARPMHLATGGYNVLLVKLEVEVEMGERVLLDLATDVA